MDPDAPVRPSRTRWYAIGGVLVVVAAALAVWLVMRPEPVLPGITRDPAPQVHGLRLIDHADPAAAREVDLIPPDGELLLLYFGFLSCPDICPMTMSDISRALADVDDQIAARTRIGFVTVDPERDTPERLRSYLDLFFPDGHLALTAAEPVDLDAVVARLGVQYEVAPHEPGDEDYDVAHSAITYVIDDRGEVVRELPFGVTSDEIAQVIRAFA